MIKLIPALNVSWFMISLCLGHQSVADKFSWHFQPHQYAWVWSLKSSCQSHQSTSTDQSCLLSVPSYHFGGHGFVSTDTLSWFALCSLLFLLWWTTWTRLNKFGLASECQPPHKAWNQTASLCLHMFCEDHLLRRDLCLLQNVGAQQPVLASRTISHTGVVWSGPLRFSWC